MESQTPGNLEVWIAPTLTYLALTLGVIMVIKYLFSSKVPGNIPPLPAKPYPILGHLPYFKSGFREQMSEWKESTGEIFSVYFGPKLIVILNSYDVIYKAFVKHGDTLSDRPPAAGRNDPCGDTGIVSSSGPEWKEQRTVAIQILKTFGMGKNILAEKVREEVSVYLAELSKLSGEPCDVSKLTLTAVSNVICSIIVGQRFEYDDAYFIKFLDLIIDQFRLYGSFTAATIFPWLRHLPGDLFEAKKMHKNHHEIDTKFCQYYMNKTEREYDEDNLDNFISAYLFEMKKMERQAKDTALNRSHLSTVLHNLFTAGSETTSTTILWFMVYMLNFPEAQKKVFEEMKSVVGTEKAPTMQDRTKLNYLNAAIMETQRLASIVPMGKEETTINGYTIPAGTSIMANLDAVLFSSDTWTDPMQFRPERFLDANGDLTQPEQFVPFSIGRRACPGEALAKMELYLFLSTLIQRFELLPASRGQPPPRNYSLGVTAPPTAFQARFVERA